jgi:lysophospholipase L1-like esterase
MQTRILAVGGSTTECLYVTDKRSWPWLLQDTLNQRLKQAVFVGNAGKSGLLAIHHDYLLRNYPLADKFEWIIVLVGINDLGAHLRQNYGNRRLTVAQETLSPTYADKAYYRFLTPFRLLERTAMLGAIGETVVQDPQGLWYQSARQRRQDSLRVRTINQPPADFDSMLATYAADLRSIVDATRRMSDTHHVKQRLVLVTQPTMYREGLPEDLERLLWGFADDASAYSTPNLAGMMDAFNQVLIQVARETNVDFIDLASMLPKDTSVFYDDAHFNDAGSARVAEVFADFFAAQLKAG